MFSLDSLKAQFLEVFTLFQKHWKVLAITLLFVWVPLWLVSQVANYLFELVSTALFDFTRSGLASGSGRAALASGTALIATLVLRLGAVFLIELPLLLIGTAVSQGVTIVQLQSIQARGEPLPPLEAWREFKPHAWPLLVTSFVVSLLGALGFAFFVLPGIVIMAYLQLAAPLTILENRRGIDALKESVSLILRSAKGFFVVMICAGIAQWVVGVILNALLTNAALNHLAHNIAMAALSPLYAMVLVALYREVREREANENRATQQALSAS
ncbi:MAG: hypothetical protein B6A08_09975 [Sorangiineae bacterium NIC37A_2]|jgi:hypothetical protein|nr:MAG: hypothetical protein B6A08_09975 [Sorangiineae bacterium NIC37A_2]